MGSPCTTPCRLCPSSSFLVWPASPSLDNFWGCLQTSLLFSLSAVSTSSWFVQWNLWHKNRVGAWGFLAFYGGVGWCWSASQVPLHYRFRIATGPENLSEELDIQPLLSLITFILCSDLQALHNSSEYLGRVMCVEVQVPVNVCLIAEDRGQGCSSSPLQLDIKEGDPAFQLPFHGELRCQWKVSRRCSPLGQLTKTSSTYLSHILGLQGGISRSSMEIVPHKRWQWWAHCCRLHLLKERSTKLKVTVRHSSTRWQSSRVGMFVCSSGVSSCCRRLEISWRASNTGTFVKKLTSQSDHDVHLCKNV